MGKIEQRERIILSVLKEKRSVSLGEAVELLGVSESTTRRLFRKMEDEGKALRILGGLHLRNGAASEYSFDILQYKNVSEKRRIGEFAVSLIESRDIIFMDSGTTVLHAALCLVEEIKSGKLKEITVITNSIVILDTLADYCKVILIGGVFRKRRKDFAGLFSERVIKSLRFSKCFLGADAVDIDEGFMTMDIETSSLDEIILSQSEESYILVDSTKFKCKSLIAYGNLENASLIITDSKLEDYVCDEMKQRGISYELV